MKKPANTRYNAANPDGRYEERESVKKKLKRAFGLNQILGKSKAVQDLQEKTTGSPHVTSMY